MNGDRGAGGGGRGAGGETTRHKPTVAWYTLVQKLGIPTVQS